MSSLLHIRDYNMVLTSIDPEDRFWAKIMKMHDGDAMSACYVLCMLGLMISL